MESAEKAEDEVGFLMRKIDRDVYAIVEDDGDIYFETMAYSKPRCLDLCREHLWNTEEELKDYDCRIVAFKLMEVKE